MSVPRPEIKPVPPAAGVSSPNLWTTISRRERLLLGLLTLPLFTLLPRDPEDGVPPGLSAQLCPSHPLPAPPLPTSHASVRTALLASASLHTRSYSCLLGVSA